jgi:hypothetical protein
MGNPFKYFSASERRKRRAKGRLIEYMDCANWTALNGSDTKVYEDYDDIDENAQIEKTTKFKLTRHKQDMVRKTGHAPNQSYFQGMNREDGTVWVIWWVWRGKDGNYSGLKPYYLFTAEEEKAGKMK